MTNADWTDDGRAPGQRLASDLLSALYGPASRHARSAIGVASLPMGISTEIEAVLTLG